MINIERRGKIDIVTFSDNIINALTTDEIRNEINKLFINSNTRLIIDLKGVNYIDSSGFGCFLSIMKTARNNYGSLKFVNAETRVKELFHILNLHTVFDIHDDLDECIKSFK